MVSITTAETSGTPIRTRTFSYDIINQVISSSVNGVATNYTYDLVGQLTSEVRAGFSAQYAYDANGNRLSKTVNGVSESYSYDSADKLLAVSGGNDPRTFGYDAAGRMTSVQRAAGTTFLAYDFDDRVVQIQDPTGVQNHTYDSLDARISSTFGGVTRNYRRSGAGSWAPVVSDGTALFSPGVSERRGGTTTYLHADTGSTDLQTTAAGAALAGREFSAFGELVQSAGTWQGQSGFMGLENFGLGLIVSNRGGVYDPGTGRVGTPGGGGRNDYTPDSGGPSNRLHPTIDFVPADEGGSYTKPWEWEDFAAGAGDELSLGGTWWIRGQIGADSEVDYDSNAYAVGMVVGIAIDLGLGGKGVAVKVGKRAVKHVDDLIIVAKVDDDSWRYFDFHGKLLYITDAFITEAVEQMPRGIGQWEQHHPWPKYLGGPEVQDCWELPKHVHQLITSKMVDLTNLEPWIKKEGVDIETMKGIYDIIFGVE